MPRSSIGIPNTVSMFTKHVARLVTDVGAVHVQHQCHAMPRTYRMLRCNWQATWCDRYTLKINATQYSTVLVQAVQASTGCTAHVRAAQSTDRHCDSTGFTGCTG
jgi:hypothetical protein